MFTILRFRGIRCEIRFSLKGKIVRCVPLPRDRNAETSNPMEKLDSRWVCEYFARLLNQELPSGGYNCIVQEGRHILKNGADMLESTLF